MMVVCRLALLKFESETVKTLQKFDVKLRVVLISNLDGRNSALVIGFQPKPILRPQNIIFKGMSEPQKLP